VLQAEQEKSTGVLARVDTAFNTKRFGIAANLAILVRLQHFVEEFQFRSESYMPETAARQASDLAPAFALAKYHMKVRQFLAPNPGENPDARCAHKILTWLIEHVPNGRWVSLRDLMKAIHYERFGPGVFYRALQNSQMCDELELDQKRKTVRLTVPIDRTRFGQFRKSAADVLWNSPLAVNRSCTGKNVGSARCSVLPSAHLSCGLDLPTEPG